MRPRFETGCAADVAEPDTRPAHIPSQGLRVIFAANLAGEVVRLAGFRVDLADSILFSLHVLAPGPADLTDVPRAQDFVY